MTEASAQKARAEAGGLAGLWTVFRREVAAQLDSPMSYIFAIVFVLVSTALYLFLPPFFTFPRADLTGFFGWIVPVLCVFVPAATMRVWAEERKENTIEMLLTFPMSPVALVLGKFLAAYAFFAATLAATWALPVMLAWLGDPDSGPILSGYLAALLLGAFFTALGTFVSSFTRDQVTSFVLSFLACGVVSLVGWDEFSSIMAGSLGWLGSALTTILGMTNHYLPLTRGIVAVADILYFLLWTGLLLFLTGVRLEGRGRPQVVAKFLSTAALALLIGALFNWLVYDARLGWADVTEGRIHTVSESTRKILAGLKVPVQVKLYISPQDKMPPQYREMERDILEKLREMRKIMETGEAHRNHNRPGKCKSCSRNESCPEKIV